jgi:hypothetical protein
MWCWRGAARARKRPLDRYGRTRWRTHADTVPWLASQILHLGCEFEVCGLPELSRYLRGLADRILRAVSK